MSEKKAATPCLKKSVVDRMLSASSIKESAYELGADVVGVAKAEPVKNREKFQAWLNQGFAGDMTYLSRHKGLRFDPKKLLSNARSIIVIGMNYCPTSDDKAKAQSPFKVARYAWGDDYHNVLRRLLKRLRNRLNEIEPRLHGRICVDTAPFMDKYWAETAGLGWQGKHTNLVSRQFGSWLLIGSLIIDVEVDEYDRAHTDHCGKCTECIEACPADALPAPYVLDATRCISYWTIESREQKIVNEISERINGWVFGCDVCIEVCPFNKFEKPHSEEVFRRHEEINLLETGKVTGLSEEQFLEKFARSPIRRPKLSGMKRNIAAASRFCRNISK